MKRKRCRGWRPAGGTAIGRRLKESRNMAEEEGFGLRTVTQNLQLTDSPIGHKFQNWQKCRPWAQFGHTNKTKCLDRVAFACRQARSIARWRVTEMARPRLKVDILEIIGLRWAGHSWREISSQTGLGYGTVCRAYRTAVSLLQVSQNPKAPDAVKQPAGTKTRCKPITL